MQTTLGVHVGDVLEARVADDDRVTVRLVVREGKHRMVRRMLANVGAPVVGLRRERFGDVLLGELAEARAGARRRRLGEEPNYVMLSHSAPSSSTSRAGLDTPGDGRWAGLDRPCGACPGRRRRRPKVPSPRPRPAS